MISALLSIRWDIVLRKSGKSFFPTGRDYKMQIVDIHNIIERIKPDAVFSELVFSVSQATLASSVPWVYVSLGSLALPEIIAKAPPEFFGLSDRTPTLFVSVSRRIVLGVLNRWIRNLGISFLNIIGSMPS